MSTIIQDYKNWKSAYKDFSAAKHDAIKCYRLMVKTVRLPDWILNLKLSGLFLSWLPKEKTKLEEDDVKSFHELAHFCRSSSCFYKSADLFFSPVYRCINNHKSGDIYESDCNGCPEFRKLVEYQMLAGRTRALKQQEQESRQKFLNNFCFWKMQSK